MTPDALEAFVSDAMKMLAAMLLGVVAWLLKSAWSEIKALQRRDFELTEAIYKVKNDHQVNKLEGEILRGDLSRVLERLNLVDRSLGRMWETLGKMGRRRTDDHDDDHHDDDDAVRRL